MPDPQSPALQAALQIAGLLRLVALQLVVLLGLTATAWAVGDSWLSRLQPADSLLRRSPFSVALGLGILAQAVFLLALAGLLRPAMVLLLVLGSNLAARSTWRSGAESAVAAWQRWRATGRPVAPRCLGVGVVAIMSLAPLIALTLYPETGFDATNYHLPYVEAFYAAGRPVFLAGLRFPIFPQLGEMLFAAVWGAGGEQAAKATQLLAFLTTGGLLLVWGRGPRIDPAGAWAAALWGGTPLAVWVATMAYVDALLTLFVVAAFGAHRRAGEAEAHARGGWLALSGAFAGCAAAVKYLGLFFLAALALALCAAALGGLLRRPRPSRGDGWRPLLLFMALALVVAGPWYLRNALVTGNPVFPFYTPIFGANEYANSQPWLPTHVSGKSDAESGAAAVDDIARWKLRHVREGLGELATLPWTGVFDRERFDFAAPLTPLLLILLPLALIPALRDGESRLLLALTAAYGLFWLTTLRDLRFLLPALPLLYLALANGGLRLLAVLPARRRPAILIAIVCLCALPGPLYAVHKLVEGGAVPVDREARRQYLERELPGYAALGMIERSAGAEYSVYALGAEALRFQAAGTLVGDLYGPATFARIREVLEDGRELRRRLDSLGVCYLMAPTSERGVPLAPVVRRTARLQAVATIDGFVVYRLLGVPCRDTGPYSWR